MGWDLHTMIIVTIVIVLVIDCLMGRFYFPFPALSGLDWIGLDFMISMTVLVDQDQYQ